MERQLLIIKQKYTDQKNKMKKQFIIFSLFSLFISFSCSDKTDEKQTEAKGNYEDELYRDPKNYFKDCKRLFGIAQSMDSTLYAQNELNNDLANKAIKAFTDYAYYCGNDSLSPIFLIKTGQVAMAVNNIPQAKLALEKCIQSYPKFEGVTAAMFLLAQMYDEENYLNNEEEARKLYQEIIDKYPNCAEAESAKGAIKMIGKTDKEVMEELKKSQGNNVSISVH